jgi:hypothetical protein
MFHKGNKPCAESANVAGIEKNYEHQTTINQYIDFKQEAPFRNQTMDREHQNM